MKKRILYFILIIPFIVLTSNVKADSINVAAVGNNGSTGNLTPFTWATSVQSVTNNFVVNGTALDGTLQQGQRYQVTSNFCSNYGGGTFTIDLRNSARLFINNYTISKKTGTPCVHTDSNGNVNSWTTIITIMVDLTIGDVSSNGTFQANFHVTRENNGSSGSFSWGFNNYDILDAPMIQDNQNTQDIISNDNANTDRLIQNDNANTDRIINNQNSNTDRQIQNDNANSQAEIDATNRNTQAVNDLNDNITDNSVDTEQAGDFFSDFQDNDHGLSSIITAPLNMIRNLSNATCSPINLTIPFVNKTMQLPCFSTIYSQNFGSLFTIYRTITFGIVAYYVCVRIFGLVKGFKDPQNDKVEVVEL